MSNLSENNIRDVEEQLNLLRSNEAKDAEIRRLREALEKWGTHDNTCILSYWNAGRPTSDGGYEACIKGKWYRQKPIDETPKCDCGFEAALRGGK